MGMRYTRRQMEAARRNAIKRFERHRRKNLFASPGVNQYVIVLDHLKPTFNIGKIFRSADAFGAREVHIIGTTFFDPTPAMGSFKWVPATFHETFDSCYETLAERDYSLYTLEPTTGTSLTKVSLPVNSAFVFGHEEFGLSFDPAGYDRVSSLRIPQLGKVQSLNVSIAASLVMYEYLRQHLTTVESGELSVESAQ